MDCLFKDISLIWDCVVQIIKPLPPFKRALIKYLVNKRKSHNTKHFCTH